MRAKHAAAALLALGVAIEAQADNWFSRQWHDFTAACVRNNAWPEPFIPADRAAARAPFDVSIANGWRAQNTLSDYHFDADNGQLTEAGLLKVRTIVNVTPVAYRVVFVLRSDNPEITAARMAAAQQAAARYAPAEPVPVAQTNVEPPSTPAYYVVDIDRSFRESTPPPRLPIMQGATSGSSSTGS